MHQKLIKKTSGEKSSDSANGREQKAFLLAGLAEILKHANCVCYNSTTQRRKREGVEATKSFLILFSGILIEFQTVIYKCCTNNNVFLFRFQSYSKSLRCNQKEIEICLWIQSCSFRMFYKLKIEI